MIYSYLEYGKFWYILRRNMDEKVSYPLRDCEKKVRLSIFTELVLVLRLILGNKDSRRHFRGVSRRQNWKLHVFFSKVAKIIPAAGHPARSASYVLGHTSTRTGHFR